MNFVKFLALSAILLSTVSSYAQYEVVVIGGGISGLATVENLAKKGITNVLLLEENSRVGGKMWTERGSSAGAYYERGAELVNTSDKELIELTQSLGIGLTERRFKNENRNEIFFFHKRILNENGEVVKGPLESLNYHELVSKMNEFQQDLDVLNDLYQHQELRRGVLSTLRQKSAMSLVSDGIYTKAFLEALMKSEFGVSLTQVNLEVLLDYLKIVKSTDANGKSKFEIEIIPEADEKFRVTGGTDSIIKKLEEKHISKIRRNARVEEVKQLTETEFVVKLNTSTESASIKTRHVVFAVPAYDLAKINTDLPEIPAQKIQKAAALPFGENAKIFLVFDKKFWDKNSETHTRAFSGVGVLESGVQFWDTTENQKSTEGVITLYPGEWPNTQEEQNAKLKEILAQLKKIPGLEQLEQHLKKTDIQIWKKSYAGAFNPFYPLAPKIFAENRQANIYFVGSDKDNNKRGEISASYGYMNGAVRTAIRAANQIMLKNIMQPAAALKKSCTSLFLTAG